MPLGRTRRGGEAELRQAAASAPVFQQPTERAAVRSRFLAAAGFRWLHGARGYLCTFLAPILCEGIEPHSACFQHYGRPTEGRPAMLNVAIVGTFAASLEDAIRGNLIVPCEIVVSDEAESSRFSQTSTCWSRWYCRARWRAHVCGSHSF